MEQEFNYGFAFLKQAAETPSAVALRAPNQEMTYDQLRTRAIRYALHMRLRGIDRKSCVALDTNRMPEGIALPLAVALLGARWVRFSPETNSQALGVTHTLGLRRLQGLPLRNFHLVDESWIQPPAGVDPFRSLEFQGYGSEDDTAIFSQSSGTTGRPKFIAKSYRKTWIQNQQRYSEGLMAVFSGFPPLSGIGFQVSIEMLLHGGCVIVGGTDLRQLKAMGTERVTASPARLDALCKHAPPLPSRIPVLSAAGAMTSPALIRRWLQYFERVEVGYGSQEAWRGGRVNFTETPDSDVISYKPPEDVRIEIVDTQDAICPPNTIGIVRIKTPEMVHEYVAAPEATAEAFRNGWFYPGDLGAISKDGWLRIHGRVKDQFNFGGVKANGADIDEAAGKAAGVQGVVSFARQTEGGIDELCVLGVLTQGAIPELAAEQIRECCRGLRGRDLVPKAVFFADHLPLNENGKVMREVGREMSESLPAY